MQPKETHISCTIGIAPLTARFTFLEHEIRGHGAVLSGERVLRILSSGGLLGKVL